MFATNVIHLDKTLIEIGAVSTEDRRILIREAAWLSGEGAGLEIRSS